tara:strand:+ start:118 stop:570 length:453 start_codon:yes stop_codon:yes gene_type:complete
MGGTRHYGYKVNNGITDKRKRLKGLSKTIKLLTEFILKMDKHTKGDFGWKSPNGGFESDDRLVRTMENLQSLCSVYEEEEMFLTSLVDGNLTSLETMEVEMGLQYVKTINECGVINVEDSKIHDELQKKYYIEKYELEQLEIEILKEEEN